MKLLADISTGETGWSEVWFIVAIALGVLAAIAAVIPAMRTSDPPRTYPGWFAAAPLVALAVAALGAGLLVL